MFNFSQFLDIGIITSVEVNHKQVESARKGQEVCIKIEPIPGESPKMFGRHFDEKDMLVSKVSSNVTSNDILISEISETSRPQCATGRKFIRCKERPKMRNTFMKFMLKFVCMRKVSHFYFRLSSQLFSNIC